MFRYDFVWDKRQVTGFLNAKRMPLRRHEDVLVFYKKPPVYNPEFTIGAPYSIKRRHTSSNYGEQSVNETVNKGRRYPTSVLQIPQRREKGGHPTQKPVALFEYLIRTYTNESGVVLDNCIGSGTTAVAALNTKRRFLGFETESKYIEIANQRIESTYDEMIDQKLLETIQ
ncbi:DNA-methyltransferase [Brevibacillus laterosporus]